MKSNLHRVMFLAAAAVVVSSTAWAQHPVIANVPFEFKAGLAKLPAGEYQLSNLQGGGTAMLRIRGTDNQSGALTVPQGKIVASKNPAPHLTFRCIASACTLVEMWDGATGYSWNDSRPSAKESPDTRLAVVNLHKRAAE